MIWQNSTALWTLAAVAIPLVIHLLNANRGKPIAFSAVRFLPSRATSRLKSLRLNDIALLILRLLLVGLIALWLAGPSFPADELRQDGLLLVSSMAQQYANPQDIQQIAEELKLTPRSIRTGIPELSEISGPGLISSGVWSELDEVARSLPDTVRLNVVYLDSTQEMLELAPETDQTVNWLPVAPADEIPTQVVGIRAGPEREKDAGRIHAALKAAVDTGLLNFEVRRIPQGQPATDISALFDLTQGLPEDQQVPLLIKDHASLTFVWEPTTFSYLGHDFSIDVSQEAGVDSVDSNTLVLMRSGNGQPVARLTRNDNRRILQWLGSFDADRSELVNSAYFPSLLSEWLNRWVTTDQPLALSWDQAEESTLNRIIVLLVLLTLVAERWLSERRRVQHHD